MTGVSTSTASHNLRCTRYSFHTKRQNMVSLNMVFYSAKAQNATSALAKGVGLCGMP